MKRVIVYSTDTCPFCDMAKDFLKEHNIKFEAHNVGEDRKMLEEMYKKTGQGGVPVLDIGGKIIIGFDEFKIKQALGLK